MVSKGYGKFKVKSYSSPVRANRFVYELTYGHIPEETMVCHSCDNPRCVNPIHLWLGTNKENQIDSINKGRGNKTPMIGEDNGRHILSYSDVINIRNRYKNGNVTQKQLGLEYGVHHSTISALVLKKSWK